MKRHPSIIAAGLAMALGSATASAQGTNFSPTGEGSNNFKFTELWNWNFTSVLIDNGILAGDLLGGADATYADQAAHLLVHGEARAAFIDGGATQVFGPADMSNFSFILKMPVLVDRNDVGANGLGAGDSITWKHDTTAVDGGFGADNFFELYFNTVGGNDNTGVGFDTDSTTGSTGPILSGKVDTDPDALNSLTVISTTAGVNLGHNNASATANTWTMNGTLNLRVDVCEQEEVMGGSANATASAACMDQATASAVNEDFFPLTKFFGDMLFNASLGGQIFAPFDSTNRVPDAVLGVTPNFDNRTVSHTNIASALNSLRCEPVLLVSEEDECDVIATGNTLTATPTSSWDATIVPEPTTLALIGASLLGMGATARRRKAG